MVTKQHAALYYWALFRKYQGDLKRVDEVFRKNVPYVLLPDAIRAYVGPRQASHFERINAKEASWMVFPLPATLKTLTKENVADNVEYHICEGYKKCVIGEDTIISVFDFKNYGHPYYHALRVHLLQDMVLDKTLRSRLIDVTQRFEDVFTTNGEVTRRFDGQQLRRQISLFEELGFIRLAGYIYKSTGIVIDNKWLEDLVLTSLLEAYPEDLARNTFKYMILSEEVDKRFAQKDFEIHQEDKDEYALGVCLEAALDEMYAEAYQKTFYEL